MVDVRTSAPRFIPDLDSDNELRASVQRLLRDDYLIPDVMVRTVDSDWPGDLAGRLLLSLSRYAQVGMPAAERATELNEAVLEALEPRGYIGPELSEIVDEQQVACHGWVVAGLLQFYSLTGDARSRAAALRVIDTLIAPALRRRDYPWTRAMGAEVGEPSGTATEVVDGWLLSSDVWCVLLSLNALVPAAIESGRSDLAELIGELAVIVGDLDVVAQHAQLHAVLAAARTIADWSVATGDAHAGHVASGLYATYEREGRTLNHATYNWFGRPDSWTEPCAIVDSIGVCTSLHALTGDPKYLVDATRIAHNGLAFAERLDGSFGLDSVATIAAPILAPLAPDAHWCCTIRGAIGLLEARETSARLVDGTLLITDLYPGTRILDAEDGTWRIRQLTHWAAGASVEFLVEEAPETARPLAIEVTVEGVHRLVTLPATVGARGTAQLEWCPRRDATDGVVRVGPVLVTHDADDPQAPPRLLAEVAGTFPGVDGPRLRLIPGVEGRR